MESGVDECAHAQQEGTARTSTECTNTEIGSERESVCVCMCVCARVVLGHARGAVTRGLFLSMAKCDRH